jgi:hypothetical protein
VPLRLALLACICLVLAACGGSSDEADRTPIPAPSVTLTEREKEVWAPLPPDRSEIPVLLYHGIGEPSDFSNDADAAYGVDASEFAKQMALIHHAGYQTVSLDTFARFVAGKQVDRPPHPLLLTFDDGRLDSWTGGDSILKKLGYTAVLFVDIGPVDRGDSEYLTWTELQTMQDGGRWELQLHAGPRGHSYIRWGRKPEETGPFYAYEERRESFDGWKKRVLSDIEDGQNELADHIPAYSPVAFAPPYGTYGQDGTNDQEIPPTLLDWLDGRFQLVFTQDESPFAKPGASNPIGRIQVLRSTTGGELHSLLVPAK